MQSKRPFGFLAFLAPALLCLPCLLLPLGLAAGAIGFATIGSWFADNALVLGLAAAAAIALAVSAGVVYARRSRGAACDVDEAGVGPLASAPHLRELDRR